MTNREDWAWPDIKAAVEKAGSNLSKTARQNGHHVSAPQKVRYIRWPKMQRLIADAIGVPPQVIWPSRYDANGTPIAGQYICDRRRRHVQKRRGA